MSLRHLIFISWIGLGMSFFGLQAQEESKSTSNEVHTEKSKLTPLIYSLEKGDELRYQITSEWSEEAVDRESDGEEDKADDSSVPSSRTLEHTTVENWKVLDVDAKGNRTIRITIDEVSVREESEEDSHSFEAKDLDDEDRKSELARKPGLAVPIAMKGQSVTIQITPTGTVISVLGGAKIRAQVIDALESIGIDEKWSKESVSTLLSDKAFSSRFTRTLALGPQNGDGVAVGQEWSRKFSRSLGALGELDEVARFKLHAQDDSSADLEVRSRMEFRPGKNLDRLNGHAVEIEVDSAETSGGAEVFGTAIFDIQRGCLKRRRTEMVMTTTFFRKIGRVRHREVVRFRESRKIELTDFQKAGSEPSVGKQEKK